MRSEQLSEEKASKEHITRTHEKREFAGDFTRFSSVQIPHPAPTFFETNAPQQLPCWTHVRDSRVKSLWTAKRNLCPKSIARAAV